MLLWIQVSWVFVLLGAQLTAVLGDIRQIKLGELELAGIKGTKE